MSGIGSHNEVPEVLTVNEEAQFRAGVCSYHRLEIDAGTSWQAKVVDGKTVLCLGHAADPRITGYSIAQNAVDMTELGRGLVLSFKTSLDNETQDNSVFWISNSTARKMASR